MRSRSDEALDVTLRNLARSNRADWIPRLGLGAALLFACAVHVWAYLGHGMGLGMATMFFIGALVLGFGLFAALGLPWAMYRHRRTMRERLRFLYPTRSEHTFHAMARLAQLNADHNADERFRRLYRFIAAQPEYASYFTAIGPRPAAPDMPMPSPYQPSEAEIAAARSEAEARRSGTVRTTAPLPPSLPPPGPDQTAAVIPLDTGRLRRTASPEQTQAAAIPLELPPTPAPAPAAQDATSRLVRLAREAGLRRRGQ